MHTENRSQNTPQMVQELIKNVFNTNCYRPAEKMLTKPFDIWVKFNGATFGHILQCFLHNIRATFLHFSELQKKKKGPELDFIRSCTYHNGVSLLKQQLFIIWLALTNSLPDLDDITGKENCFRCQTNNMCNLVVMDAFKILVKLRNVCDLFRTSGLEHVSNCRSHMISVD